MKTLPLTLTIAAVIWSSATQAPAALIQLLPNFTISPPTQNLSGDADVFGWLQGQILLHETANLVDLPDAIGPDPLRSDSSGDGSFDLTGLNYITIHYGNGKVNGVKNPRYEAWYVNGMTGNMSFPTGALSTIRGYGSTTRPDDGGRVPDGGTTLAALGLSLMGLGSMRRFMIKKA